MYQKFKLRFQEAEYHVNKEKRTVICVLKADYDNELDYYIPCNYHNKNFKELYYFKSVGMAKCDPKDEFDITLGKRIAESKAKRNAYKSYINIIKGFEKDLSKSIDIMRYNKSVMLDYIKKEEEHYKTLIQ